MPRHLHFCVLAVAILRVIVRRAMYPTSEQLHREAMLSGEQHQTNIREPKMAT